MHKLIIKGLTTICVQSIIVKFHYFSFDRDNLVRQRRIALLDENGVTKWIFQQQQLLHFLQLIQV